MAIRAALDQQPLQTHRPALAVPDEAPDRKQGADGAVGKEQAVGVAE
jgi:hypothetical protein